MVGTERLAELPTRVRAQDKAAALAGENESGPGVRLTLNLVFRGGPEWLLCD